MWRKWRGTHARLKCLVAVPADSGSQQRSASRGRRWSAGSQGGDSGSSAQEQPGVIEGRGLGAKGLLWWALQPWQVLGAEALLPAGPAQGAGPGQAVAAAGKGVTRSDPDKGTCHMPARVPGCLCQPTSWRRRPEAQGQLSQLLQ